ncbi:MAG: NUDIX domain-containing protein [Candidatus Omnitrophica bacterium]|nr:NUDIX domain-containing protein [Candidatus Omnitrophota bacterium]
MADLVKQVLLNLDRIVIRVQGINMGTNGAIFAEGHVDDDNIFMLRNRLDVMFPNEKRTSRVLHISLLRVCDTITPKQFKDIYNKVFNLRNKYFGTVVVNNPMLLETLDRWGFNQGRKIIIDLNSSSSAIGEVTQRLYKFSETIREEELVSILNVLKNHLLTLGVGIKDDAIDEAIAGIRKDVENIRVDGKYKSKYLRKLRGEMTPIVNEVDEIIGVTEVGLAHIFGLKHRVPSAFVMTPGGRMLIQRRAPGRLYELYLSIFGGHIKYPQTYEEGMREELREELKLGEIPLGQLIKIGKESYDLVGDTNREWRELYVYMLTDTEYEEVLKEVRILERLKLEKTREEFGAWLAAQAKNKTGYGEVWGYYEIGLGDLINSATGKFIITELKDCELELHYMFLIDEFTNGLKFCEKVPFTPDLLERIIRNDDILSKLGEFNKVLALNRLGSSPDVVGVASETCGSSQQGSLVTSLNNSPFSLGALVNVCSSSSSVSQKNEISPDIYIFENHGWAYQAWEVARLQGLVHDGAVLIHLDSHADMMSFKIHSRPTDVDMALKERVCFLEHFIVPAVEVGLVGEIHDIYSELGPRDRPVSVDLSKAPLFLGVIECLHDFSQEQRPIILDIDMDYFALTNWYGQESGRLFMTIDGKDRYTSSRKGFYCMQSCWRGICSECKSRNSENTVTQEFLKTAIRRKFESVVEHLHQRNVRPAVVTIAESYLFSDLASKMSEELAALINSKLLFRSRKTSKSCFIRLPLQSSSPINYLPSFTLDISRPVNSKDVADDAGLRLFDGIVKVHNTFEGLGGDYFIDLVLSVPDFKEMIALDSGIKGNPKDLYHINGEFAYLRLLVYKNTLFDYCHQSRPYSMLNAHKQNEKYKTQRRRIYRWLGVYQDWAKVLILGAAKYARMLGFVDELCIGDSSFQRNLSVNSYSLRAPYKLMRFLYEQIPGQLGLNYVNSNKGHYFFVDSADCNSYWTLPLANELTAQEESFGRFSKVSSPVFSSNNSFILSQIETAFSSSCVQAVADSDEKTEAAVKAVRKVWACVEKEIKEADPDVEKKAEPLLSRFFVGLKYVFKTYIEKIQAGQVDPFINLRLRRFSDEIPDPYSDFRIKPVRVGFLPLAANPPHHGHDIIAMMALTKLSLDTVIFRVQGEINYKNVPESDRLPIQKRHYVMQKVVELLWPLVRYTDLGSEPGSNIEGFDEMFNFLELNADKPLHVYYLMGVENAERIRKYSRLQLLAMKNNIVRPHHKISIGYLQRGELGASITVEDLRRYYDEAKADTGIDIDIDLAIVKDPNIDLQVSSTYYRDAHDPAIVFKVVDQFARDNGYYGYPPIDPRTGRPYEYSEEEHFKLKLRPITEGIANKACTMMSSGRFKKILVVGVDGASGSGKTSIVEEAMKFVHARGLKALHVPLDILMHKKVWRGAVEKVVLSDSNYPVTEEDRILLGDFIKKIIVRNGKYTDEECFFQQAKILELLQEICHFRESDEAVYDLVVLDGYDRRKGNYHDFSFRLQDGMVVFVEGKYALSEELMPYYDLTYRSCDRLEARRKSV